jgi:hypothetical protein
MCLSGIWANFRNDEKHYCSWNSVATRVSSTYGVKLVTFAGVFDVSRVRPVWEITPSYNLDSGCNHKDAAGEG